MPFLHRLTLTIALLIAVACTDKATNKKAAKGDNPTTKKEVPKPATGGKKAVAKPKPLPAPPIPARTTGASRPDEATTFLSIDKITDNADLRSLVLKLADTSRTPKSLRIQFEGLKKFGAVDVLLKAMRSRNTNIRSQSAKILRRMKHKSKKYTKQLNKILLSDPDPDVRGVIAKVMVYHHAKGTAAALIEALSKDTAESVRMHAAWALGAIGDRKAVDVLISALNDEKTWVRLRAVGALKRLNAKKAVRHLVGRLSDSNVLVKDRAYEALRALTKKNLGKKESSWRKVYPAPK